MNFSKNKYTSIYTCMLGKPTLFEYLHLNNNFSLIVFHRNISTQQKVNLHTFMSLT